MYRIGNCVKWTSSASGSTTTKHGVVVQVVPAGERPSRDMFPTLYKVNGVGMSRDHESVVVLVDGKPYWPRVKTMEFDAPAEPDYLTKRAIECAPDRVRAALDVVKEGYYVFPVFLRPSRQIPPATFLNEALRVQGQYPVYADHLVEMGAAMETIRAYAGGRL